MHLNESKKSQSGKRRLMNLKIHQSENLIDLVIMTEHGLDWDKIDLYHA